MGNLLRSPSLLLPDLKLGSPSCHTEWFSFLLHLTNFINICENIICVLLTHLLWFHTFLSAVHRGIKADEIIHLDLRRYQDNHAKGQNHQEAQFLCQNIVT